MSIIDERLAAATMTAHIAPAAGESVEVTTIRFAVDHDAPVSIEGSLNGKTCSGASWGTGKGTAECPVSGDAGATLTLSGDAGDTLSFQADVDAVVTVTIEGP